VDLTPDLPASHVGPTPGFQASKVVIVAGKGGVGKTTVAATLGLAAADSDQSVLFLEVDGTGALSSALGVPEPGPEPSPVPHDPRRLRLAAIRPQEALTGYLGEHGLQRLTGRLLRTGMLDLVATATPGIRDLVVLGRIRQLAERDPADLVVVDAPAAGHAISFLRTPADVLDMVRDGPILRQAHLAADFLADSRLCSVSLVTLPQVTPIRELIETAYAIEEDLGVALGPVILNAVEPGLGDPPEELVGDPVAEALVAADRWIRARIEAETRHSADLLEDLALPLLRLPRTDLPPDDPRALASLAALLASQLRVAP